MSRAKWGGQEATTLAVANLPSHTHRLDAASLNLSVTIPTYNGAGTTLVDSGADDYGLASGGALALYTDGAAVGNLPSVAVKNASGTSDTGASGGNTPFSTLPPYLGLNYIICLVGEYPAWS